MQVHLREEWNVGKHDKPQEVEVREREVKCVWHLQAPLLRHFDMTLG